jgi:hypothetical protein
MMGEHSIQSRRFHGMVCAVLGVAIGLLVAAGCTPAQPSPSPAPAPTHAPAAVPTQPYAPPTAVGTATPVPAAKPTAAPLPAAGTSLRGNPPAVDARKLLLTRADLGPGWELVEGEAMPDAEQATVHLWWRGNGDLSPEGLAAVSSEVVVYEGASAAKGAMQPLDTEYRPVSAPEMGDASRAYTGPAEEGLTAVYMEATVGSVWMRVAVVGDPRSEIKVSRAAELLDRMISRLPRALTVEEHPIVAASVDEPTRIEYFRRISPDILKKRQPWREPSFESRVAKANRVLAPFGYRVAIDETASRSGGPYFTLFEGDIEAASDIAYFGHPSVAADGSDLAMALESVTGPNLLLRSGYMEEWDPMEYSFTRPVFVGTGLVSVVMDGPGPAPGSQRFAVMRNGEAVYRFESQFMVDNPIKGLWPWDGRWVLEVAGEVVVDGRSLNQEMGYDEVFGWRLLGGEPFYLFEKGGEIGISYAGEMLPVRYEQVIHYQCCEPAAFNLQGNDSMVWFHALRDGTWYYVESGSYRPVAGTGSPLAR